MSNKGRRDEAERIASRRWTEVPPSVEGPATAAGRRSAADAATYVSSFRISVQVVS
ncbi:hypothetical protein [Streptomyces sp. 11x1]|uniref:hypothetical protein n=1 Tax=Streptomyces sp. 11x1 TaxID=3038642 RepID=UPI002930A184|nr:hypothetical protein [Streptomyces sp. 11x1]WNZ06544.1 hypothetical protein P8T65_02360 [Streptomyces sp. 11x1]